MSALVFMDTETTGLSLDDDIWEFAAIRRELHGQQTELHLFIQHDTERCRRLPESFRIDHDRRFPQSDDGHWHADAWTQQRAAVAIDNFLSPGPPCHIVGAVPNFDTERLSRLLRRWLSHVTRDPWHHHLIDIENLAVGYLHAGVGSVPLPWDSEAISRAVGVDPEQFERHTAMGDARWAMALYDAITSRAA